MELEPAMSPDPANTGWGPTVWTFLSKVGSDSPLVQCITNFVTMDLVANTLLAAGASPAMLHSLEEIPDFTPQANALCINVGTLSPDWIPSMNAAAELASKLGKPWVLDPVAAGASGFRMKACLELVGLKPSVIRGNGSEIIALSKASVGNTKGVDSSHESMDAVEAAKSLAHTSGCIVAVSGAVDIITDGEQVIGVYNGVSMLQKITGTGCSVTALIAAFVAVDPSHALEATASALSVFGIAAEKGMDLAKGPASLRMHLIDSLYGLDQDAVQTCVNISSL
ncbi:hydroxyethylthiazole kinase family protein [Tripterygium wilfordii]|uniref:Hydroxyethylthiazole kinase n=1 Tax=Tripterygium wilfordii TaxID=458696 RepID=A0A7J7CRD6_TRIWF|nr:hydroxyethylthiazole kinase [Tripterygium wilfordii]XP_038723475.1 hydroxyethylthiazole kinase [Tripterygium wilfordii]KAF5736675.1 hydroxyethylthiazole kinase family protein [Tripterygium wilfordii]